MHMNAAEKKLPNRRKIPGDKNRKEWRGVVWRGNLDHQRWSKPMSRERAKVLNDEGIRVAHNANPELAKQKLLAAIREDPTWGVPWNNLGVVYRDLGESAEALRCLRKAIELGTFQ